MYINLIGWCVLESGKGFPLFLKNTMIHTYIYIHTYIHIVTKGTLTDTTCLRRSNMLESAQVNSYINTSIHTYTYIHTVTQGTLTDANMLEGARANSYIHTHIHIFIYIHTYIHTYSDARHSHRRKHVGGGPSEFPSLGHPRRI